MHIVNYHHPVIQHRHVPSFEATVPTSEEVPFCCMSCVMVTRRSTSTSKSSGDHSLLPYLEAGTVACTFGGTRGTSLKSAASSWKRTAFTVLNPAKQRRRWTRLVSTILVLQFQSINALTTRSTSLFFNVVHISKRVKLGLRLGNALACLTRIVVNTSTTSRAAITSSSTKYPRAGCAKRTRMAWSGSNACTSWTSAGSAPARLAKRRRPTCSLAAA
jgi:hypothetical protein